MEGLKESKPRVLFEFQIDKIIGISSDGRYQVQLASTWVSKFHLIGCEHLIEEFLQEQSKEVKVEPRFNDMIARSEVSDNNDKSCAEQPVSCDDINPIQPIHGQDTSSQDHVLDTYTPIDEEGREFWSTSSQALEQMSQPFSSDLESNSSQMMLQNLDDSDNSLLTSEEFSFPVVKEELEPISAVYSGIQDASEGNLVNSFVFRDKGAARTNLSDNTTDSSETSNVNCTKHDNHQTFSLMQQGRRQSKRKPEKDSNLKHLHRNRHCKFECNYCRKIFGCNNDLARHIRTHTGEKPFFCEICTKSFSLKGNLENHKRTHTSEKSFVCPVCAKGFKQRQGLRHHSKHACVLRLKVTNDIV